MGGHGWNPQSFNSGKTLLSEHPFHPLDRDETVKGGPLDSDRSQRPFSGAIRAARSSDRELEIIPGSYVFLGVGNPTKNITAAIHHVDFDEAILPRGTAWFLQLAQHG